MRRNGKRFDRNAEMTRKLMMVATLAAYPPREASAEGGSMRGAFGAWAETETVGDYTWPYRSNGIMAENMV